MAIWQFEFYIIPAEHNNPYYHMDDIVSWKDSYIPADADGFFAEILPPSTSWSKDMKLYGRSDSTCIKFIMDNENIEAILCRLDLRNLSKRMLMDILGFVNSICGKIFVDGTFVEAKPDHIVPIMKASDAAKFCANPSGYLGKLGTKLE